ncbi:MAG TPA: flagellar hook-basal body complex protein [Planctomycetaceae bacterium]|nr:flagellar hook-basal body complex protein [Planctomycetaceae bacterium]HQZ64555.1 flagellar hook-basal body complex protein [Planctomycetaceae bacterium]
MANSLLTGISGLRGHQKMLEVVGNNLANLNTTAFKASRVIFSDLMYEVQRNSSSASGGQLGSVNGVQVGTGSRVSQVDLNFQQGNLEATGNPYDLAIDGSGFFIGMAGNTNYFTRAGVFAVDDNGYLSDPASGHLLQRFGTLGEPDGVNATFQTAGDNRIYIPIGASIAGKISQTITVSGNLSSATTGPVAQKLLTAPFLEGGNPSTLTTRLTDLDTNTTDYVTGDKILINGQKVDGSSPDQTELLVDGTTTVGDLIAQLNAAFPGSTITLDASGKIIATATSTGPSKLAISISDGGANIGRTDLDKNNFMLAAAGKDADHVSQTVQVFDESGAAHTIGLELTKQTDGSWNIKTTVDPTIGTALDDEVNGITFLSNGSFAQVTGTGVGDANITVQFNGQTNPQTIGFSFGIPGTSNVLSQRGDGQLEAPLAYADGFKPGTINEVSIDTNGKVIGLVSNGVKIPLAQMAIASFRNTDGLVSVGGNYYQSSLASGDPQIGSAMSGDRGAIRSGQLEGSNVDLALEFTRLIIAQRGFSANARTITVTDQVLQELTSIIR